MKKYGIVTYNRYANFTNYGSALQTWALQQAVNKLGEGKFKAVVVDYCPDTCKKYNILNPFENMWDKDEEYRKTCEKTLPAIKVNYEKFEDFYQNQTEFTTEHFTPENFDEKAKSEGLDGFICGSDTIFCADEFGIDDGFFSNYPCMKNGFSISYAASFGDISDKYLSDVSLQEKFINFNAISLRENKYIEYVRSHTDSPVEKVVDPTLLLEREDLEGITAQRLIEGNYLLLYSRRHDQKMIDFADRLAKEKDLQIIDISLKYNENHKMLYEAGVEEFLSLVKYADCVVTNSFHGIIMATQFSTPFYGFFREQCDVKIAELMELFGVDHSVIGSKEKDPTFTGIDYQEVHANIRKKRIESIEFLKKSLNTD